VSSFLDFMKAHRHLSVGLDYILEYHRFCFEKLSLLSHSSLLKVFGKQHIAIGTLRNPLCTCWENSSTVGKDGADGRGSQSPEAEYGLRSGLRLVNL
jgi:hypothetical protein